MKQRFPVWQSVIFILILISLACNMGLPGGAPAVLPTVPAAPTAAPSPLPPTIVETVPPVGSQIALQGLTTLYFSEKMDRASVETALSADFPGGFVFSWVDDTALTLAPKAALPASSKVTITLGTAARSASGLAPIQPINLSYQTPGPLRVTQILPAAMASDVSPDSAIVVSFNQPVTPLGADQASLPAGLSLEPAAPGKGEWLNTSTYIFHAEPALAGGVKYIARVNLKLTSTSGMPLDANNQNTTWAFSTTLPSVEKVLLQDTNGAINLNTTLEITFNQSMDAKSVESAFSFTGPRGLVSGTFEWNKKFSMLTFKPAALLERAASYTLIIDTRAHSKGGAPLSSETQIAYQSVPDFGVASSSFPNGATRPATNNMEITFTTPLANYTEAELESLVSINPKPGYYSYYVEGAKILVSGVFQAGKSYTVTFSSNLKDLWGQALAQESTFLFTEPDASPDLSLGTYLPALFVRPENPLISVQAVNLNSIFVSRGAMTAPDFLKVLSDYQYEQSYTASEIKSWQISPNLPRNDNQPVPVSLSDGPLTPGFYFVQFYSPENQNSSTNRYSVVTSNINVTLKASPTEALVWAVDLRTQTPVQNMPVTLYDNKAASIANGVTDEHGLWRAPLTTSSDGYSLYAIIGQPGDDQFGVASSDWGLGISPWDFNLSLNSAGPRPETYLYTERPVYRPGDTVQYRGILKTKYDGRYTDTAINTLDIVWMGPNGKISSPQSAKVSDFGTFSGEYVLPANAIPGYYSISVNLKDQELVGGSISLQVADYRKPEINLSAALSPNPVKNGQKLTGLVKAEYFFGSPVSDLPFTWTFYARKSYFSIPKFTTGTQSAHWLSTASGQFGNIYSNGEGRTGADGTFSIPLDGINADDTSELTLEISASESGGFPVSARATATLHPESFYVGIRPDAWVGQAGSPLGFSLLSVDWDKKPVSQSLTVAFEKVRWEPSDASAIYGNFTFTPIYTPVDSQIVTTDASGNAHVSFTPPDAGTYVLDVTSAAAHTQTILWVSGAQNAEWPNLPYQQLQITANKDKYKPGESAEIFIPNPFNAPVLALLTSERSTFKSVEVVSVPPQGYKFNLPLTDESAPNLYVSATLIGPDNVDFRQGYINLPVEPSAFTLNIDLKATPEKAKPGDSLTLDLTVTDSKGQPVQGEFSMAVVDLAALALADPNSEDIVPAYYDIQPLGVHTGLTAAIFAGRVLNFPGGGGGGGGADVLTLREKFPDTAYWKADILTDAQGKARITLTLPDNLTTWQVDTRGLTKDTRVGQARVRVVTSKEVLIRPQTPRFLVVGDHAELAAIINNTTSQALHAVVSLQAAGLTLDEKSKAEQTIQLPANGRARVSWNGLVQDGDAVIAIFTVKAGAWQDASRPTDGPIPVLRYAAPQTFSTAGSLTGSATRQEIIALPRSFQPLGGSLQLEMSPSLAAAILGSLKALDTSEHIWSTEQLVSTLLPNVVTYRTLKESGITDADLTARLQTNLATDLNRLITFERYDGGWPWTIDSTHSDPYLTAYAIFALQQALESGLNLENIDLAGAIERGRNYLTANAEPFTAQADLRIGWQANRAAFYFYVLQKTGDLTVDPSITDMLYENRNLLAPWARAMLLQTLHGISPVDERVRTLLSDVEASAIRSATGVHWESPAGDWMNPGTPLFTSAVILNALAERDPATPLAADAVRYLASQRDVAGRWASSYETAWVILALNKYMRASGELRGEFGFSATLNSSPFAQGQASGPQNMTTVISTAPLTQLNLSGANSLLITRQAGTGTLYYRAALTVDRPVESAPAIEQGISISRQFTDCASGTCQPVTAYTIKPDGSGRVSVKLSITLPNDAYYLMIQDYIPAGSDILDSSLKTSQQGEQDQSVTAVFDPSDPFSEGWGWWYFNRPQIYSDHILWSADYLPAGTYELNYTIIPSLAGQYHILPAHAWQAYFPEVQGTTAGAVFEIKP